MRGVCNRAGSWALASECPFYASRQKFCCWVYLSWSKKKVAESPLRPCSSSLLWEILTIRFWGFLFLGLESISCVAEQWQSSLSASGLGILQQAAEAVTAKCKERTVSPAAMLLKDWLLPCCAGREQFGTTVSVLLVVCNPAAKSSLFPAGFWRKELVSCYQRLRHMQYRQWKDQGFSAKQGLNWTVRLVSPEKKLFNPSH